MQAEASAPRTTTDARLQAGSTTTAGRMAGVGQRVLARAGVGDGGSSSSIAPEEPVEQTMREVVRPSQIGTASQLISGGVAGAVSKTCTAPLARLTILFQVQGMRTNHALEQASMLREASRIFREEGFRAFWKGNGVTVVHRLPYSAINFFSYENYKLFLTRMSGAENRPESLGVGMGTRLLAGGGAGLTAASLTYPLDLVRTRLAAQTKVMYYRGIVHALVTISQEEGFKGLYKGIGPTLLCVGPNIAINFCAYETLKSIWVAQSPNSPNIITSLCCGSVAGICSSTATFPLDLIRRRMQLEGAAGQARVYKSGLMGTLKHILRSEGLRGLYRGIMPEYFKVIPSVGIVFMTYEFMKRVLQPKPCD
ncbi:mitochondrial substrate carrier family protein V [Selaginella moellendorffii]|nr:mitochondrial substrate carrier family protein V [Selaginella moellendorffii]|eukprot:XP_002992848.2 mitochondrial substrate carrier family protein V [Selaginella moellendorffii]